MFCAAQTFILIDQWRARRAERQRIQAEAYHQNTSGYRADENDEFAFNEGTWHGQNHQASHAAKDEPDYATALRDAHAEASKISDKAAAKFAAFYERKANEPGLHPKIHLYRKLVAMLLRERAKGYNGSPERSEPTPNEISRLQLNGPAG